MAGDGGAVMSHALKARMKQAAVIDTTLRNPSGIMQMYIPLNQIDTYKDNPRRAENPAKLLIKDSIRAGGLETALPVSRIDGQSRYFVYKGGNTRLACLQELYEETGDQQFAMVRCEFHPFLGDWDALTGSMIENLVRAEMTFIDKALGFAALITKWEAVVGPLSLEKAAKRAKSKKLPVSTSQLNRYLLAAALYEHMPLALDGGVGQVQVERLSKLKNAGFKVWVFHCQDGGEDFFFTEIFAPALVGADRSDGWEYQDVEDILKIQMVDQGIDPDLCALNLTQALKGEKLSAEDYYVQDAKVIPSRDGFEPVDNFEGECSSLTSQLPAGWGGLPGAGDADIDQDNDFIVDTLAAVSVEEPLSQVEETDVEPPLVAMRRKSYLAAVELLEACGVPGSGVREVPFGFGFLVTGLEVPNEHPRFQALFWWLMECSQTFACPLNSVLSELVRDKNEIYEQFPVVDEMAKGKLFWCNPEIPFDLVVGVMRKCREVSLSCDGNVWEVQP